MAPVDQSMSKVVRILETAAVLLSRSLCSPSLWLVQQKWFSGSHWRPIISHSLFAGEAGCCRSCRKYMKSLPGASPIDELLFLKCLFIKMALDASYYPFSYLISPNNFLWGESFTGYTLHARLFLLISWNLPLSDFRGHSPCYKKWGRKVLAKSSCHHSLF